MKKLLIASFLVCFTLTGFGQTIVGSLHDFSGNGWSGGKICIACHTPHNGDLTIADAPLWNHELTVGPFTPYSSPTLDATVGDPDNNSKLCLSCHDGTIALENFGGATGGTNFISPANKVGPDMSGHHPVTFIYNAALATTDGELFNPVTANSGLGSTIDDDMLFGNSMECASCHDVHNSTGLGKLLIKSNALSALCLTCHDK